MPSRLIKILKQTKNETIAGVGRRANGWKKASPKPRIVKRINDNYQRTYGTAAKEFWYGGPNTSIKLRKAARRYVLQGEYSDFFANNTSSQLSRMFHARLQSLSPNLAKHILKHTRPDGDLYDGLALATSKAPNSKSLNENDRLLFFCWALFQAFYGLIDNKPYAEDESTDEEEPEPISDDDTLRKLAEAALTFLEKLKSPRLKRAQIQTIKRQIKSSLAMKGTYQAPNLVTRHKSDGTRRRIMASMRLFAFARLLQDTRSKK